MRAGWRAAERAVEVREAARAWKRAGMIDGAALTAIEAEYPTTRYELATAWNVLIFVLVSAAVLGVQAAIFGFDSSFGPYLFFAAALAGATELLRGSRLAGTGSDAATSFWALVNLIPATILLLKGWDERDVMTATIAVAAAGFGLACWRWGFALYGAFAAAAGYLLLARLSAGRLLWAVAGAALCAVAARLAEKPALSPSRRRAFVGVFVVSALALYAAGNLYSANERAVERIRGGFGTSAPVASPGLAPLFAAATVLVPVLFLAWGIRARRRLILNTGALIAALSILTIHHYIRFGSIAITAFGLALVGVALWLNRRLRTSAGADERGFTVSPLLSPESESLAPAAALAAAAAAPVSPPRSDRDFIPGGGRYGGGGATGDWQD